MKFTFVVYKLFENNQDLMREDYEFKTKDEVFNFAEFLLRECDNLTRDELEGYLFDKDPEPIVLIGKLTIVLARKRTSIDQVYKALNETLNDVYYSTLEYMW